MEKLIEQLKRDEGYIDHIYKDTEGYFTAGYGHLLKEGDKIPSEVLEEWFRQDVAKAIDDYCKLPKLIDKDIHRKLNPVRRRVIINMIYNMGLPRVLKFVKMWQAIRREDWQAAHDEMLDSTWAKQVKTRASRLAKIMLTGDDNDS